MAEFNEQSRRKLLNEYFELVKKSLHIQKTGNMQAYIKNAIQAENVAQKLQALSRK